MTMAAISDEQIQMLPVSSFDGGRPQAGRRARNNLHIRWRAGGEVAYLIDGMSVRDCLGRLGTSVNTDAISELNLLSEIWHTAMP
jgi:hypothetical protein